MARPGLIRADTIDLQDHDAPSAQSHPHRPNPLQINPTASGATADAFAPHQAETLREVALETKEEELRSPRVSWANGGVDAGDIQQHAQNLAGGVSGALGHDPDEGKMAARGAQDDLAVAQNGGHVSQTIADDAEMDGEESDDDMMDKISSSPSIDDEDIDFELVYALHTFIATVEGQANATKGDAMVLLDDSNSYWWLVRVVKDSSIGYLPAEHIETPTERLARLNKHRNIDLSATMLGDQAEKVKNPIKTAIRRRKAKNVSFAAPTYVDYSDYDYGTSDDEDGVNNPFAQQQQAQAQTQAQQQQQSQQQTAATTQAITDNGKEDEEAATVAPPKPRTQPMQAVDGIQSDSTEEAANKLARTSEEIFETNGVEGPKKKADGTVRDSFFKDDTVETKKITLTPNLLRDENGARESSESVDKGIIKRPSFDRLEKELKEDKKKGKDKKEKEKKGGFRGLFSRKDKKQREDDDESLGKRSMDIGKESMDRPSEDITPESSPGTPQRTTSKLQKQQARVEPSLARKVVGPSRENGAGMDLSTFLKDSTPAPAASMRIVDPDADLFEDDDDDDEEEPEKPQALRSASIDETKIVAPTPHRTRSQSVGETKPVKAVKPIPAKSRMQIEDSSEDDVQELVMTKTASSDLAPSQSSVEQSNLEPEPEAKPTKQTQQTPPRPVLPGTFPDSYVSLVSNDSERTVMADQPEAAKPRLDRLSESPIEVSPITPSENHIPPLTGDTSSQEEHSSPVSSPSPELIDRDEAAGTHRNQDSITTSTSTTTVSTWNDTSLRAFFDSGADIRDLLVVVYDKTDVEPVGSDHPVAGALFKEQNAKLAEITNQLDSMLGDWLARKQRSRGIV